MKYKRCLTIMLVSILLITSISTIGFAHFSILNNDEKNEVEDTGVVECYQMNRFVSEKEIYLIAGDTGTIFMGRLFKKYLPVNMDDFPDFKKVGLEVEFTGKIAIKEILSIAGLVSLRYKALPIKLIEIRETGDSPDPDDEIKLDFDIEIVKENKIGEPIPVTAILKNMGTSPVQVSEMALEVATLDFTIKTPVGSTLSFNKSRLVRRLPEVVTIEPGKPYSVEIEDIAEPGLFINELVSNFVFTEGAYSICGHYESGKQSSVETADVFECELDSKEYLFSIADDEEPENAPPVAVASIVSEGFVGEKMTLDGSASYDPDGKIVEWKWTYTNGDSFPTMIGYGEVLTYVFKHPGVYNVVLRVTDDKGAEDHKSTKVTIIDGHEQKLASISGRVITHSFSSGVFVANAIPVVGAKVTVQSLDGAPLIKHYETVTDSYGLYELQVDPYSYLIIVSKEGYHLSSKEVVVGPGEKKAVYFVLKKIQMSLTFDIILESDVYKVKDPIPVIAKLTNTGEQTVKVSEMCLECKTLDFVVVTPDLQKIHYIGPIVKRLLDIVEVKPGESYELTVDITNAELGYRAEVYDFTTPGRYAIVGMYLPKILESGTTQSTDLGFMFSSLKNFEVEPELDG